MTYNLNRYNMDDRNGDGQRNNLKPTEERAAIISIIAAEMPDVLAVQEIGNPVLFEAFCLELQKAGVSYAHTDYLQRDQSELNLAILSRFPIVRTQHHIDDRYSIGTTEMPVLRGVLESDIQVHADYSFRLIVAHLKSKVFHPLGQTEMRRNEARLLGKHVRHAFRENPSIKLLVLGTMNDNPGSAALREIMGNTLIDLRPADPSGSVWTHFNEEGDEYTRVDYVMASEGMYADYIPEKSRAILHPMMKTASDHRPVHVFFRKEK